MLSAPTCVVSTTFSLSNLSSPCRATSASQGMSAGDVPIRHTTSSPGGASFRRVKEGSVRFSPDLTRRDQRHQATSPTTGQTRPHSSPSKGRFYNSTPPSTKTANGTNAETSSSNGSSDNGSPNSSVGKSPNLFPLTGFLRLLLEQEKMMWGRNELLLKALKSKHRGSLSLWKNNFKILFE